MTELFVQIILSYAQHLLYFRSRDFECVIGRGCPCDQPPVPSSGSESLMDFPGAPLWTLARRALCTAGTAPAEPCDIGERKPDGLRSVSEASLAVLLRGSLERSTAQGRGPQGARRATKAVLGTSPASRPARPTASPPEPESPAPSRSSSLHVSQESVNRVHRRPTC